MEALPLLAAVPPVYYFIILNFFYNLFPWLAQYITYTFAHDLKCIAA